MLVLPLVVNTPGPPATVPPDQFRPLVLMSSLPVKVPLVNVSGLTKLTLGARVLKPSVAPLKVVVPVPAML